jgi:hypothetical protein
MPRVLSNFPPYRLDKSVATRWINFENPAGAPGMGGRAASALGIGRKGAADRVLDVGETAQLCDVEGPGTLRHFWCSTLPRPLVLRSLIVRVWFDEQEHPSIECPLGDLMGVAHGKAAAYTSAVHSVAANGSLHLWLPMPFLLRARVTITNDGDELVPFHFQIALTLGDRHDKEVGRLHACFLRENPTTLGRDFELMPMRQGNGRYLGSIVGVRSLHDHSWGEGEVKVYLDGDEAFPTLCGTGSEDWIGLSSDPAERSFLHHGTSLRRGAYTTMYRWHLLDPVIWHKEARVTIQQLGRKDGRLIETFDDWSCSTFWYEPLPSRKLPPFPAWESRTANLWTEECGRASHERANGA